MKRRKFLKITGIGAGIAAVPPAVVNADGFLSIAVRSIINRELHFLKIDPDALHQFTAAFAKYITKRSFITTQKLRFKIAAVYFVRRNARISETVNYVSGKFLLSSDFFINGMDETRIVKFVGMHDLDVGVCANPFSHMYYPSGNQLPKEPITNENRAGAHSLKSL